MKLQDLATTMLELWNLMDTPIEEQQEYQHITCNIAASEHEITEANSLSEDFIKYVSCGDFVMLVLLYNSMTMLINYGP